MFLQRKQLVLLNLLAGQLLLLCPRMMHGFLLSPPRVSHTPSTTVRGCTPRRSSSAVVMCEKSGTALDKGIKRDSTWSNVGGEDLVQVSGDVWAAERPFVWNGIDVGEPYRYTYICFRCLLELSERT